MSQLNRRQFLTLASAACGTLLLPKLSFARAFLARAEDDHFFLEIVVPGGMDSSYLFDARPLAMTAAGKIQNYLGEEPIPYMGVNGTACLRSPLTNELSPLLSRLTVVNGVVMTPTFDGHDQNMNFLLTGSPFGGESFLPHLNQKNAQACSLDGLLNGSIPADLMNHGGMVPLDPFSLELLKGKLARLPAEEENDLSRFVRSRFAANSQGGGKFSAGSREMLAGFNASPQLRQKIQGLRSPDSSLAPDRQFVQLLAGAFQARMARSAAWVINDSFDTHSAEEASRQPAMYKKTAARLRDLLQSLIDTPFDSQRSLLDVTTVMISSEFSRTMRQENFRMDRTGTDHNSVSNMFLFAGKGIRPGQVIGATDFQSAQETLSKSHLTFDQRKLKAMGRPFDFTSGRPTEAMPEKFDPALYLTVGSVVNTMYSLFGVPSGQFRKFERSEAAAPVLRQLLS